MTRERTTALELPPAPSTFNFMTPHWLLTWNADRRGICSVIAAQSPGVA